MGTVENYFDDKVASLPEFEKVWDEMRHLYNKKLWHQLTIVLLDCMKDPNFQSKHNLKEVYDIFISSLATKIKPLSLVEIAIFISEFLVRTKPEEAITFMKRIKEIADKCVESQVLCDTTMGMVYLKALKDLPSAREIVESCNEVIKQLDGVTSIHSRYYQLSALYYQNLGKHADYYREGLKYLGATDIKTLSKEEKESWAFSIGIAALLGDNIYNFGELLTHEIFESLLKTQNSWLVSLMEGLCHGELDKLDDLSAKWKAQPDLMKAEEEIYEKATVLCLIELVFRRPINNRTLSFNDISKATRVPIEKVEYLIMRALSLHLMEGRIDEIEKSVSITWLQPRVLDYVQIESMYKQIGEWCERVTTVKDLVEIDAKAILA